MLPVGDRQTVKLARDEDVQRGTLGHGTWIFQQFASKLRRFPLLRGAKFGDRKLKKWAQPTVRVILKNPFFNL